MTSYDVGLEPPRVRELTDDPGTLCVNNDCDDPRDHLVCQLCDGTVCLEADDVADCGDGPAHEECHQQGCANPGCEQDRADDALLARDERGD